MRYFLLLLLLASGSLRAVDTASLERGATAWRAVPYRAIETPGRRAGERLPLILFLHGSGQAGSDDDSQLEGQANGALELVDRALDEGVPLVFAAPQDVDDDWEPAKVFEVVAALEQRYPIDPRRIVLTGLSSGAIGVWDAVKAAPRCFAAAVPMSGMTGAAGLKSIARVPEWVFHGDQDSTADIERGDGASMVGSRAVVRALRAAGGAPRLTEYADLGHVIWPRAYSSPRLLPWMLDEFNPAPPCDFDALARGATERVLQPKPLNSAPFEQTTARAGAGHGLSLHRRSTRDPGRRTPNRR
jgi:predicted esterase